jgi:hypothetical protein
MIRPAGLLLVIPHLFAVPVSVLQVGLLKSTELYLDVKNILQSHSKHHWRCSKSPILGLYLGHNAHQGENSTFQTPQPTLLFTIIGGGKVPVDSVLSKHTKYILPVLNVFRQSVQMSTWEDMEEPSAGHWVRPVSAPDLSGNITWNRFQKSPWWPPVVVLSNMSLALFGRNRV